MAVRRHADGTPMTTREKDAEEANEQDATIARLEAKVAELKRRLGGKERECEDYEKLLGKYLHAGEEADRDMVHLRAEVAELKEALGECIKHVPASTRNSIIFARVRGLLEE